jgi:hypothetical protein
MDIDNILESLILKLDETGISDLPGGFLYSGIATLTPGKVYMLGYNPGGDDKAETNSPKAHLQGLMRRAPDWNEYMDGVWYPGRRRCPAGRAPLQTRVQALLEGIGLPTRSVCASNLIFVRSRDQAGLAQASQLAEKCWAVHRFLLEQVQPQAILSIGGGKVFDFIASHGRLLSPVEQYASGHGNWKCQATRVAIGNRTYNLISLPHLSRYAVNQYPNVILWVRTKLL